MLRGKFKIANRFYGDSSVKNIIISRLVFWLINNRRKSLQKRYKGFNPGTKEVNVEQSAQELKVLFEKGMDKLNIGGGDQNLKGFINIDWVKSPGVENQIVANALDLSFIPSESISQVHSNHFVEHLTELQFENHLKEYYRVLKPGGVVSIRCPNALGVCYGFFFEEKFKVNEEVLFTLGFPEDECVIHPLDGWQYKDLYGLYHWLWAVTGNPLNEHHQIVTPSRLDHSLSISGFEIRYSSNPEWPNCIVIASKPE